ncbi:unnamed protein product [Amoebophrya sp. A25]|nr:unnamed protein product [Amoebophrya sp. A25]|eukprot:GSA25T00012990001.1
MFVTLRIRYRNAVSRSSLYHSRSIADPTGVTWYSLPSRPKWLILSLYAFVDYWAKVFSYYFSSTTVH